MKKENQLLNRIGKAIGLVKAEGEGTGTVVEQTVEQASVESVVEAVVDTVTVALEVDTEAVQAALSEATAKLEDLSAQFAELNSKYEGAIAALSALEAEKAKMVADALAAKLAARKERVELAIGTDKAAGLLAATENLSDDAFEAVVSALTGSVDAEAKTELFTEVGQSGEVSNPSAIVEASEESKEMKLIRAKFGAGK